MFVTYFIIKLSFCYQEHNPKLGKPKKHPAYCVYMAYRLMKNSDEAPGDMTSAPSTGATEEDVFNEDDSAVVEELEDKQLSCRLESLEQVFYMYNSECTTESPRKMKNVPIFKTIP